MPYRTIELAADHVYHVYNRGVDRQPIFLGKENWGFFLRRMRQYFVPRLVDVLAYCLMPTHYHLLVQLRTDDFGRQVMQPFAVSYTKAVNKQQGRVGPLFQGPFRVKLVEHDEHLQHLSRYIHLNPVAARLVPRPEDWVFSSYREYVGLRNGTLPATDLVLAQFPSRQAYQAFVESYVERDIKIIEHLLFDEE